MKVILAGGSGQVGTLLCRALAADGHQVVILSRKPAAAWKTVPWDAQNLGSWISEVDGADAVINLAGRSVNCRYTAENRKLIYDSRVRSARVVGEAIAQSPHPPRLWLQMSTATIYSHRYEAPNDDLTGILGGNEPGSPDTWRFSIEVAKAWEQAADEAVVPRTRKVLLRSAVVMSPDRGGIFDVLLGLVRNGLGGNVGGWAAICIVDSRAGFHSGRLLADRAVRNIGTRESRFAESTAQRPVHANPSAGVGCADRTAGGTLDVADRRSFLCGRRRNWC